MFDNFRKIKLNYILTLEDKSQKVNSDLKNNNQKKCIQQWS